MRLRSSYLSSGSCSITPLISLDGILFLFNLIFVHSGFVLYKIFTDSPEGDITAYKMTEDDPNKLYRIFKIAELAPLLELIHHFLGI